jgi:predicted transcriptional regulator
MLFSRQVERAIDVMLDINERGFVTRSSQKIDSIRYYMIIWQLRDNGLIEVDGVDNRNQKIWVLTAKGKKITDKLKEIREIMGESNGEM